MEKRKQATLDWKRLPGCGTVDAAPPTPPDIDCSSSSSPDDQSDPQPDRRRTKRRPLDRIVTRLNFDECVVTHLKNRQWVSPKVKRSVERSVAMQEGGSQSFEAVEGRQIRSTPVEDPRDAVTIFTQSTPAEIMEDFCRDAIEAFVQSPFDLNYSEAESQSSSIGPMDSVTQQPVNELYRTGEPVGDPILRALAERYRTAPKKDTTARNGQKVAECSSRDESNESCAILVVGEGRFRKLPVERPVEEGSPAKDSTLHSSVDIVPKSPVIRSKRRSRKAAKKDVPIPDPPACVVPESPPIPFHRIPATVDTQTCEDIVPKSPVIVGRQRPRKRPSKIVLARAPVEVAHRPVCESPRTYGSDEIVQNSPVMGPRRVKRRKSRNSVAMPDNKNAYGERLSSPGDAAKGSNNVNLECNSLTKKSKGNFERVTPKSPVISSRNRIKQFPRKNKSLPVSANGKLLFSKCGIISSKHVENVESVSADDNSVQIPNTLGSHRLTPMVGPKRPCLNSLPVGGTMMCGDNSETIGVAKSVYEKEGNGDVMKSPEVTNKMSVPKSPVIGPRRSAKKKKKKVVAGSRSLFVSNEDHRENREMSVVPGPGTIRGTNSLCGEPQGKSSGSGGADVALNGIDNKKTQWKTFASFAEENVDAASKSNEDGKKLGQFLKFDADSGPLNQSSCIESTIYPVTCPKKSPHTSFDGNGSKSKEVTADQRIVFNLTRAKRPSGDTGSEEETSQRSFDFAVPVETSKASGIAPNVAFIPSSESDTLNISVLTEESPLIDDLDATEAERVETPRIESCSSQENSVPKSVTTISDIQNASQPPCIQVSTASSLSETGSPAKQERPTVDMDSAKKKRRPRKGGHSARLQNLLRRQLSNSRMFRHEVSTGEILSSDKGCQLRVDHVWEEYGRTLVLCSDISGDLGRYLKERRPNEAIVLVLDPRFVPIGALRPNGVIKIFPPWQTLTNARSNATYLLNLFGVQIIPSSDAGVPTETNLNETVLSRFFCPCLENVTADAHECTFKMPRNGNEIVDVLFPPAWAGSTESQLHSFEAEDNSRGTIAEMLAKRVQGRRNFHKLIVSVQRVFRSRCEKGGKEETDWSILGRDSKGEFCVVSFGSLESRPDLDEVVLGNVYTLNGFEITRRIHGDKEPALWAIINSKTSVTNSDASPTRSLLGQLRDTEHNTEQLFLYVIKPVNKNWDMKRLETFVHPWALSWLKPQVTSLAKISSVTRSEIYISFSIIVKVLHADESRLYVTDASLADREGGCYSVVHLRSTCCLAGSGAVVLLQDVQLCDGQLFADRYSRVLSANRSQSEGGLPLKLSSGLFLQTSGLRPAFVDLSHSSVPWDLVTVQGTVASIDEKTAYEWPACSVCSNNFMAIVSDQADVMFCNKCDKRTKTFLKMSLEVLLECPSLPQGNKAVVKLLQASIVKLLSHSMKQEGEGYKMDLVRGQNVGPLLGLVLGAELRDSEMCFSIQEIDNQGIYN